MDPSTQFAKYHGLGNDFVLLALPEAVAAGFSVEAARQLCDRHRGVGADGVLLLSQTAGATRMRIINADGSRAEMCGNGLRCAALHLWRLGWQKSDDFVVLTDAGEHRCRILATERVEVEMARPDGSPASLGLQSDRPWLDTLVHFDEQAIRLTAVSMGNPHAVSFDEVGERRWQLGPRIGADARFEHGVNVGFARLLAAPQPTIELHVHERGAGWTQACGTGACAAAVAAVLTERAAGEQPIEVRLPGGALLITVGKAGVRMAGEARLVFEGNLPEINWTAS